MISILFALSLSAPITMDNASLFLGSVKHSPIFIALVNDWCPHCHEILPTWHELEAAFISDERLLVATLNCESMRAQCSRFPDSMTPGFYWVSSTPEKAEPYHGAVRIQELLSFIDKKLSPSLIEAHNHTDYTNQLEAHNFTSIFVIQSSHSIVSMIKRITLNFSSYPCRFITLQYHEFPSDTILNIDRQTGRTTVFPGPYTEKEIARFFASFAFPRVGPVSQDFFSLAGEYNLTVMILSDEAPYFVHSLETDEEKLPPELRCGILKCGNNPRMCTRLVIPSGKGPKIILINPRMKYIWRYRGNMEMDGINTWCRKVLAGEVKPGGSGAGFAGFIREILENAKSSGKAALVLLGLAAAAFAITIIFGASDTLKRRKLHYYTKLS